MSPPDGWILTSGDSGPRVRRVQRKLQTLGYEVERTGTYGTATRRAVIAFQQGSGIPADGGFGPEESHALDVALSQMRRKDRKDPPDSVAMRVGDEGPRVLRLQRRLESLRYWIGPKDGVYGSLTEQAVLAFQGVEGLARDGIAGPQTTRALRTASPARARNPGDSIEIDEGAQVLHVVRDGSVVWTFHTSTGTEKPYRHPDGNTYLADTPDGEWEITWQVDGWRRGRLGTMWRPKYFHEDGIAIHGYSSVPAYPASHGCARVSMQAMDFIWENDLAPVGSTVHVSGR